MIVSTFFTYPKHYKQLHTSMTEIWISSCSRNPNVREDTDICIIRPFTSSFEFFFFGNHEYRSGSRKKKPRVLGGHYKTGRHSRRYWDVSGGLYHPWSVREIGKRLDGTYGRGVTVRKGHREVLS